MDDNKYPSSIWMNYDMEWDRNYFTFFHVDSGNDIEYSVEYIRKDEHDRIVAVMAEVIEKLTDTIGAMERDQMIEDHDAAHPPFDQRLKTGG